MVRHGDRTSKKYQHKMHNMKLKYLFLALGACIIALTQLSCEPKSDSGWTIDDVEDDPVIEAPKVQANAPLYWTVYEYCFEAEASNTNRNMPWDRWVKNVEWVEKNLLPYGYDMICTDGFMTMYGDNSCLYMTHYGEENGQKFALKDLVALCKEHGLRLGVYDNPLWIHCDWNQNIPGTKYNVGSLTYQEGVDKVLHPDGKNDIFQWAIPSHPGCKEFIDGFFKYYSELGVTYIRMDFMCLFETGHGMEDPSNPDTYGRGYGREEYKLALQYINEAALKYGVFTSIVMPNNVNHAELERTYMNMMRAESDAFCGHWAAFSGVEEGYFDYYKGGTYPRPRGQIDEGRWPHCYNVFDGFVYWSDVTGRGKIILDGDFTRLTTLNHEKKFNTADECQSVISLQLLGGGPIACADQYDSEDIENRVQYYQNEEMLALNKDGFVGKPLSRDLGKTESQIWVGQMQNGDWVVGLFNREPTPQSRYLSFATLTEGEMQVRDLWEHKDLGTMTSISVELAPHACKVYRLTK